MTGLSRDELRRFGRDGYLVLPDAVPESLLAPADREIDGLIGEVDPDEGDRGPGANLWFVPRRRLPSCEAVLRDSGILDIAGQLVRPRPIDLAFDSIQVATTAPPWPHVPGGPHVDGHGPGQDPPASFTLLVGVLLTDQSADQAGNLWVWPGSHLDHQRLFRERGTRVLQETGGHPTLLGPPVVFERSLEVRGRRGDVVLAHYLLGHNKGGNTTDVVRRTIYYRLVAAGHAARWEETFLDPWAEFEPVRQALGQAP